MGTNYYARVIPSKRRIEELKNLLENTEDCGDSWTILKDQIQLAFGRHTRYDDGNEYHLGKKSYGWKLSP